MIYPPRPTAPTTRREISFYEDMGYWAYAKFNGSCAVVNYGTVYDRHGKEQPTWKINCPDNGIYCGEYMNKGELYNGMNFIIWDILSINGQSLVGDTLRQRDEVLFDTYKDHILSTNDWLVTTIMKGTGLIAGNSEYLTGFYDEIVNNYAQFGVKKENTLEGLVLKDPDAVLKHWTSDSANGDWQVKIRKPNKLYSN